MEAMEMILLLKLGFLRILNVYFLNFKNLLCIMEPTLDGEP